MRSFILSLALVFVTAEARRASNYNMGTLPEKPEGLDTKVVGRYGKPSGFEAVNQEQEKRQFVRWSAYYGQGADTSTDFDERYENWVAKNAEIRENNLKAEESGNPNAVYMDHNKYSALSESEFKKLTGVIGGQKLEFSLESHLDED